MQLVSLCRVRQKGRCLRVLCGLWRALAGHDVAVSFFVGGNMLTVVIFIIALIVLLANGVGFFLSLIGAVIITIVLQHILVAIGLFFSSRDNDELS